MTKIDDGGPAFAFTYTVGGGELGPVEQRAHPGMSLRDYFASQALIGIIAYPGHVAGKEFKTADTCARFAYVYADAMLKARSA